MNLRKKIASIAAIGAITLSMMGGAVAAQTTDSDTKNTDLLVTCPATTGIELTVNGQFAVDATAGANSYNASLPGGFMVEMDLTCNWSLDFSVSAQIGAFQYQGTAAPGQAQSIPGGVLQLQNGTISRVGPDSAQLTGGLFPGLILTGTPDVESTVFPGLSSSDLDIIVNDHLFFPFIQNASPGVSTANWDGELVILPPNLADGLYQAPLTVTLTVN